MTVLRKLVVTGIAVLYCTVLSQAVKCSDKLPIEIEGKCYQFVKELRDFESAKSYCEDLETGAKLASIKSAAIPDKLKEEVYDYVAPQLEKALFWIGFVMEDTSVTKAAGDRNWHWDYNDSLVVQKEYKLWDQEGGPTNKGKACAALNMGNSLVQAMDCRGEKLPTICMTQPDEDCKHDMVRYQMYGKYCIAPTRMQIEHKDMYSTCNPHKPIMYNDDVKEFIKTAAKNIFLGGGLFLNYKYAPSYVEISDGSSPEDYLWEEGHPSTLYDCVVLSLQQDNTLKLKTIKCEFKAAALCEGIGRT